MTELQDGGNDDPTIYVTDVAIPPITETLTDIACCGVMCCYVMRGVRMLTSHARVLECSVCLCTVYMLCIRC